MSTSMAVFCPCREPGRLGPDKLPVLIDRRECYFAYNALLFCPQCTSVRCPFCTDTEPVSWYCSACLMETTRQEARASSNRCMRNCLRCPRCNSNAVLKPVEVEGQATKRLEVECASLSCGWKFTGSFDMPVKDVQPLSVAQQVRLLVEHPFREVLGKVEQQISARPGTANPEVIYAVPPHLHSQVKTVDAEAELPQLVPLRAKRMKKCRVCETTLADPVRQPSQPNFRLKSLARQFLPSIEAYRIQNVVKLVLRNFGEASMDVQIASPDADTVVLTSRVVIPSLKSAGFFAPLFLVERETTGSRQAFMANASQKEGRGWAVCELEVPSTQDEIRLFTSSAYVDDNNKYVEDASRRLGAWISVRIVPLESKRESSKNRARKDEDPKGDKPAGDKPKGDKPAGDKPEAS